MIEYKSLLIVSNEGDQHTERGTAAVMRINGRRCLCFPGAIELTETEKYFAVALWPEHIADPFPPSLATGPSLPGWLILQVCSGPEDAYAWRDLARPPFASGALARCLMACYGPDGQLREPRAIELAALVPEYRWSDGPSRWPWQLVFEAVRAMQTRA